VAYALIWSPGCEADLEGIIRYVSSHASIPTAAEIVVAIHTAANRLRELPFSGRAVASLKDPAFREIFVFSYRIVYMVRDDRVEIRMIIHTRRKFPPKKEMHRLR